MWTAEVFVSYRRGDEPSLALINAVERVYDASRMFVDRSDIQAGAAFPAAIADGVRSCSVVLALISANWMRATRGQTDWVVEELNYAQQYGKPVVPVLLGVRMPDPATLPPQIQYVAYRHALPREATDLGQLVNEIVQRLETLGVRPQPRNTLAGSSQYAAATSWIAPGNPGDELARVVRCCVAAGGKIVAQSVDGIRLRFGAKIKSRVLGLMTKIEDLPVDLQVRVAAGPGVTLVEARCDEAFGQGILQRGKYDAAFARIWSLIAPR